MSCVTRPPSRRIGIAVGVATLVAAMLSGCASVRTAPAEMKDASMEVHEVSITRRAVIPGPVEEVFDFIAAEDVLPKVLTGYGPLPAVIGTSDRTGPWSSPGSQRVVHLADASTVHEQVTRFIRPARFAYRIWAFEQPVVRSLASSARGEWTFEAVAGGTQIVWTYTFIAKSGLAAWPLSGIAQMLWRGYMDVCLENARRHFAQPTSAVGTSSPIKDHGSRPMG